jgi:choline dehydrogenase-like flavoprotein
MVQRLKPVDVVTIGVGLTGSLAALELAKEGLKIVGLERGAARFTVPDFQSPAIHDELRFSIRKGMMQDNTKVAVTFRNNSNETALPIRRWESFLPGQGLGGSFVHWNGQSFRAQVADFTASAARPFRRTSPTTTRSRLARSRIGRWTRSRTSISSRLDHWCTHEEVPAACDGGDRGARCPRVNQRHSACSDTGKRADRARRRDRGARHGGRCAALRPVSRLQRGL